MEGRQAGYSTFAAGAEIVICVAEEFATKV
jgi:hypothetical protein